MSLQSRPAQYQNGINMKSVYALIGAGLVAIVATFFVPVLANYALFIGGGTASVLYRYLMEASIAVGRAPATEVAKAKFERV